MKKRLVSLMLAVAVVFTMAASAFAATPTDVAGKKEQGAIETLSTLGIINGYTDGTFKPDNKITRAELAKILVVTTGNDKSADALKGVKSKFKDVPTKQWYTGFVNVAEAKGFILGDKGTGKFRPNDNIKFEEVTAVVLRALGYQDKFLSGTWPYNVIVKADDINLFSSVDIAQGSLASRAVVAQIVSNALTSNVVNWDPQKEVWANVLDRNGITQLLISKLGTTAALVVTANAKDDLGRIELDGNRYNTASNFVITEGKTLTQLFGHKVTVVFNANNQVIALVDKQNQADVLNGTIVGNQTVASVFAAGKIKVKVGGVEQFVSVSASSYANTQVYYNGDKQDVSSTTVLPDLKDVTIYTQVVTDIYGGTSVVAKVIQVKNYNPVNALFDSYVAKNGTVSARVNTSKAVVDVNDSTVVTINGEAKQVTDLAKNDVVDVVRSSSNVASIIDATRNSVTGKITTVRVSTDGVFYTVNGVEYKDVNSLGLSKDNEYKLFLNKNKEVAGKEDIKLGAATDASIVLRVSNDRTGPDSYGAPVTDDVVTYYSIKDDKVYTENQKSDSFAGASNNDDPALQMAFVKEWKITNGVKNGPNGSAVPINSSTAGVVSDKTDTSFKVQVGAGPKFTFNLNSNTVVLDASKSFTTGVVPATDATVRTVSKSDLSKVFNGDKVYVSNDGLYAQYVVIAEKGASDALPTATGLFRNISAINADTWSVTLNVAGQDKAFIIDQPTYNSLSAAGATYMKDNNTLVKLTGAGSMYTGLAYSFHAGNPADNKGDVITALSTGSNYVKVDSTYYTIDSNTVVYVLKADNTLEKYDSMYALNEYYLGTNNYDVYVAADSSYLGSYQVAKAIVIRKL